jgi:hypothetical protein
MTTVYQPKLVQCRPQYTVDSDTGRFPENVLWFQSLNTGTPTLANLLGMAAGFDTVWGTMWATMSTTGKHYTGSVWTDWSSNTGLSNSSVGTFTPVAGSNSGTCSSFQVAVLISLSNGQRFKGGHFRIYLPYVASILSVSGAEDTMSTTIVNNISSRFAAINASTTGSGVLGGQTQVLYRFRNDLARASLYQIASFSVSQRFATQRRRLRHVAHR